VVFSLYTDGKIIKILFLFFLNTIQNINNQDVIPIKNKHYTQIISENKIALPKI
jgi:hypothetical protein